MNLLSKKKIGCLFLLVSLFILWQLLSQIKTPFINIYLLPSPHELSFHIKDIILKKYFYINIIISATRVLLSMVIAIIIGVSLGILSYENKASKDIIIPIIDIIRPIPNIAWLPIIIVVIPSLEAGTILIPLIGAVPPILLSTFTGIKNIPDNIKNKLIINKININKRIFDVLIPGSFSYIRNGINISIGVSWMGIILAEMTAGKNGIGYFTWIAYQSANYENMIIGTMIIGILGILSSKIFMTITKKKFNGLYF